MVSTTSRWLLALQVQCEAQFFCSVCSDIDRCLLINLIGLQGCRSISIAQRNRFARVSIDIYRTRQMLRISYFWTDWNSYVWLGVFHAIFSTKKSNSSFFPKYQSQILNYQILRICRVLCYSIKKYRKSIDRYPLLNPIGLQVCRSIPIAQRNKCASVCRSTYTCILRNWVGLWGYRYLLFIACDKRVQNDGEAAFCGIGGYSIHARLETVRYISEGKTNTNNIYLTWCSSVLLKTTDTLLLKYLIKEIGIDRKCQIPTSPVDINDNLLYFLKALQKK